jgi:hypothetical protein
MSRTIHGTYTTGIKLTKSSDNPVIVTATGTVATSGSYAIYGAAGTQWTIATEGRLSGATYGITLASGGTITNGSNARTASSIYGGARGVVARGDATTVANYGTVASKSSGAVSLLAGGALTNGSNTDTSALISGGLNGVNIEAAVGTVVNFGTIMSRTSRSGGFSPNPAGIYLAVGGTVVNGSSVDHSAQISAVGVAFGIFLKGSGNNTIDNYGTISGYLPIQIYGSNNVIDNHGLILGEQYNAIKDYYAISVGVGNLGIYNDGTVSSHGIGIKSDDRGGTLTVVNGSPSESSALIIGAGSLGFFGILSLGKVEIVNFGTISGSYWGIDASAGTIRNAGTIIGSSGVAVGFDSGHDRVAISPHAVFIGRVIASGDAGDNTLELTKGAHVGTLTGFGSQFADFGHIVVKADARWRLEGTNTFSGDAALRNDGRFIVAGSLIAGGDLALAGSGTVVMSSDGILELGGAGRAHPGQVVVEAGHTLSGAGWINGVVIDSGVIEAQGGTLAFGANASGRGLSGAGAVVIDAGAVLVAKNRLGVGSINFLAGGDETLGLGNPAEVTGVIAGFGATDTIDLINIIATGSFAHGTLAITTSTGGHAALHFAGSYGSSNFVFSSDGHGGTAITLHA